MLSDGIGGCDSKIDMSVDLEMDIVVEVEIVGKDVKEF